MTEQPVGRYLLFGGADYYPGGGMDDFIASSDSITELVERTRTEWTDWYQIVDHRTMQVVAPVDE